MDRRVLEAIRDAADAFGTTQPADLLKRSRMNRTTLVRAIGNLLKRGLVDVDEGTGAMTLTEAGKETLEPTDFGLPKISVIERSAAPLEPSATGPKAQPAGFALLPGAAMPRASETAATRELGPGLEPMTVAAMPVVRSKAAPKRRRPALVVPEKPPTATKGLPARKAKTFAETAIKQVRDTAVAVRRRRAERKAAKAKPLSKKSARQSPKKVIAKASANAKRKTKPAAHQMRRADGGRARRTR